ncbi:RdgB/HAM1 family non-canonical purine NTP pyrophosphatase [Facilibium subflavum]|uniref:RdgB/HAM1 family non-canonical purine NTP pyrophosphatase n=1 Tax=Facilibium subflavum TaxID=2219058 RepID=UPI000E655E61|nr:RdgB/HAM1 family non-canonical purine NTP pyrophosphatase [Facilibium subflavum]
MHTPSQIVFASSNPGKITEVSHILSTFSIQVLPQSQFYVPDAKETGLSFIENAILKARNCCHYTKLSALADDSGLVVPALDGAPGIYSARFAGEHGNHQANIDKLLKDMLQFEPQKRQAYFECVMAFMTHENDPSPIIAQARLYGEITYKPSGNKGFGYDPIFRPQGYQKTLAEISPQQKNTISHRGQALQKLRKILASDHND